jgi:hypothetical protein
MNTLSPRAVSLALFLLAVLFAVTRADAVEAQSSPAGPPDESGSQGPTAVWSARIPPQADLAMAKFTQVSPRKQQDCG